METLTKENLGLEERIDGINVALRAIDAGFSVTYKEVAKNNCIREALVMQNPEFNVLPTVYPDQDMMDRDDAEIAEMLRRTFMAHARNMDMSMISSESYIRKNVFPRLVNGKNIATFKKDGIPFIPYLDLAICFTIRVPEFNNGGDRASVKVTNELLKASGLTLSEIKDAALQNMKNEGYVIKDMLEMISEMTGIVEDDLNPEGQNIPMIILTNPDKFYGGTSILCADSLREIEKRIGDSSFVLLPSSVHEFIATRMGSEEVLETYKTMVSEVNSSTVSVEDYLSDSIYVYSKGKISVMK